ncbi:MAG: hypothetical protein WC389_10565 [Lutibacter sp.]|jgi:hypothetical protein
METTPLKQTERASYLKVVNNTMNKKNTLNEQVNRIYINTLTPHFGYINQLGEITSPKKYVLL